MAGKRNSKKNKQQKQKSSHANYRMMVQVPNLRVTLPYFFNTSIAEAGAGLGVAYSFSVNSAFDPDFSGGGLQPLGYDQYAQFYGRYRVTSFRAVVTFSNRTVTPQMVGVYVSPQSTLPAVAAAWPVVNSSARSRLIQGNTGGNSNATFNIRSNMFGDLGLTPSQFKGEADFQALISNSPARLLYLHVFTFGRSAIANTDFAISLYMNVEFSQPVALSLS